MSPDSREAWFKNWEASPDGERSKAHMALRRMRRGVLIADDNSFSLADLPEGRYSISVFFYGHPALGQWETEKEFGSFSYVFDVPPVAPGHSGDAIDVGTLEPQPTGVLDSNEVAPDIFFQALDGSPHMLSEFRGKVVLLDFWGTWCGGCVQAVAKIKAIRDKFHGPDFVVIGLDVSDDPAKLTQFMHDNGIDWMQAALGEGNTAWPCKLYQVPGYPSYWLIDRNGKIVYGDWRVNDLQAAIADALGGNK
jgi:thiol-disulfide isomerase/thioredoxin